MRASVFCHCIVYLSATLAAGPSLLFAAPPPLTFDDGRGTFEINERLRFEDRSNNFDFDSVGHSATDDSWLLQRLRLGAIWKPTTELSLQVQLQDVREWGSERPKVPFILGAEGNDALDVRIASITFGDPKKSPATLTLGRQIIVLGEERIVGASDWNNFARTFDAGKVVWYLEESKTTVTAFVSSVVNIQGTASGDGWESNHSSFRDLFSGIYISSQFSPVDTLEGYAFWRDKKDNNPIYSAPTAPIPAGARSAAPYDIGQDVFTVGGRFLRAPKAGAVDAEFEAALQGGHVNRQTTTATGSYAGNSPTLDQRAWALHALVGYTPPNVPGNLRFDLEYNLASGDTNRTDGKNGSFMIMFPSNHKWYGFMDVFAWKNLREAVATVRFNPLPKTALRLDYHDLSLYSSQDAWYRANGAATVRPLNSAAQTAPTHAGSELDLTGTWTVAKWATLDIGWARFFAGSYLSATGARSDANFFYAQTTFKF